MENILFLSIFNTSAFSRVPHGLIYDFYGKSLQCPKNVFTSNSKKFENLDFYLILHFFSQFFNTFLDFSLRIFRANFEKLLVLSFAHTFC